MAINHELSLPEKVLLLALRDDAGTIPLGSMYGYAMAGAIIAELTLHERIGVEKVKKSDLVNVVDERLTGDPLLDEALGRLRKAKRRASVATWVGRFAQMRVRDRVADRLVQRGILRRAEGRVLFVFSRKTWPTVDPRPEFELVERMRRAIFDDESPDVETAILIGLANPSGLLAQLFGRKELKPKKQRIADIATAIDPVSATGQAVKSAIEAATAAMLAVSAAVAASSSS